MWFPAHRQSAGATLRKIGPPRYELGELVVAERTLHGYGDTPRIQAVGFRRSRAIAMRTRNIDQVLFHAATI